VQGVPEDRYAEKGGEGGEWGRRWGAKRGSMSGDVGRGGGDRAEMGKRGGGGEDVL